MKLLEALWTLASIIFVGITVAGMALVLATGVFYLLANMYCWILYP